jgi:hypothetical protein
MTWTGTVNAAYSKIWGQPPADSSGLDTVTRDLTHRVHQLRHVMITERTRLMASPSTSAADVPLVPVEALRQVGLIAVRRSPGALRGRMKPDIES